MHMWSQNYPKFARARTNISTSAGVADQNVEPTRQGGKTGVDSMGRRQNRSSDMGRCNNHSITISRVPP